MTSLPLQPGGRPCRLKRTTKQRSARVDRTRTHGRSGSKRVTLQLGETVRFIGRSSKGNLDQNEVEEYEIVDLEGAVTGTVTVRTSTSLRPPHRTSYSLEQRDGTGTFVTQASW